MMVTSVERRYASLRFFENIPRKRQDRAMGGRKRTESSVRVLIVEDEANTRETFAAILKEHGYEVETAGDGHEAIKMARKKSFNIAFIDIVLNGLNGVETFEKIKKINPEIVTIMMTAYSVNDLINEALKKGAYTCIYKPLDIDKVISLIKEHFQN
ncbi:MAG: response regulator [Candidatus Omnitrophica bacterium]|nr:response regulator [Candidatus Omnitrophota bacterium]